MDGLKGFPDAVAAVFPQTQVHQLCIVHMIRHSLAYVSWQDRRTMVGDLRAIYDAPSEEAAREALKDFKGKWDGQYPS